MSHTMVLSRSAQKRLSRQIAAITAQSSLCENREPNGRLSRKIIDREARNAMTEQEAKSVVIEARIRHGVDPAYADLSDAGRPNAGTVHGRMYLDGSLNKDQWDAAEWFILKRAGYLRSILAVGEAVQSEGPDHGMMDSGAYEDWCKQTRELWAAVMSCLQEVSIQVRSPVIAALDHMLNRNWHVVTMEGDLRVGLNAIHRHFLADRRRAS